MTTAISQETGSRVVARPDLGRSGAPEDRASVTDTDVREARWDLGRQLAAWRDAVGITQTDLAQRICYTASTIANVEMGRHDAPRTLWVRADRELAANGLLVKAFDQVGALTRDYHRQRAHLREHECHKPASSPNRSDDGAPDACGCGLTVARWGGRETRALREAMRLPVRAFAEYLGVAAATVSAWENKRAPTSPYLSTQDVLDRALKLADVDVHDRFWQLLDEPGNGATDTDKSSSVCSVSRWREDR